jgi:hypothetical protein
MKHYFYFLLLFNCSCSQAVFKSIDEGLMYWKIYFINTNPKEPAPFEYIGGKIWFKDSCFILERKSLNSIDTFSQKGNIHSQEYLFYKYTFLDLRNMHCQDYLSLQDTATIFCNYFLNPAQKENLDNRFYGKIIPYFVPDTTFELTDTIIKGENFKRVQLNFHKEKIDTALPTAGGGINIRLSPVVSLNLQETFMLFGMYAVCSLWSDDF